MGFDKFEWMRVIAADARPTDGEKFILWNIAFVSVRSGEDTFCVRQTTIAERCATSVKTVKRAMGRARSLGYIEISQARQRGRAHHRADEYRLTLPAIGDNLSPINEEEIGDTDDRNRGHSGQKKGTQRAEIGDTAEAVTSENDTPKGLNKGLDKGLCVGTGSAGAHAAVIEAEEEPPGALVAVIPSEEQPIIDAEFVDTPPPDPEPSKYCPGHRNGTTEDCRGCMRARQMHKEWSSRQLDRIVAATSLLAPSRPPPPRPAWKCNWCHDGGLVLMSDGTPGSSPCICHHDGARHKATPAELEALGYITPPPALEKAANKQDCAR